MYQKKASLIVLLIGLFMFQSLWNVAAAFCLHEQTSLQSHTQNVSQAHFGHHQAINCQNEKSAHQAIGLHHTDQQSDQPLDNNFMILDDHQDHLPSMSVLLPILKKNFDFLAITEFSVTPQYLWSNQYQSPDLLLFNPPPELSPLKVG